MEILKFNSQIFRIISNIHGLENDHLDQMIPWTGNSKLLKEPPGDHFSKVKTQYDEKSLSCNFKRFSVRFKIMLFLFSISWLFGKMLHSD